MKALVDAALSNLSKHVQEVQTELEEAQYRIVYLESLVKQLNEEVRVLKAAPSYDQILRNKEAWQKLKDIVNSY